MPGLTTCGEGDVFAEPFGETDVKVSVQLAAGNIIGGTGMASFGSRLEELTVSSGIGQVVFGSGLKDSRKAEIHLVVRDHGSVVSEIEVDKYSPSLVAAPRSRTPQELDLQAPTPA
jgi:hypothetical protein